MLSVIETAVTVGYSCRLISSDTIETYIVDAESAESVRAQLMAARDHLCGLLMSGQLVFDVMELVPWMKHVTAAACVGRSSMQTAEVAHGNCALVINGHSLVSHSLFCVNLLSCLITVLLLITARVVAPSADIDEHRLSGT